jgi:hypothetical protein
MHNTAVHSAFFCLFMNQHLSRTTNSVVQQFGNNKKMANSVAQQTKDGNIQLSSSLATQNITDSVIQNFGRKALIFELGPETKRS